MSEESGATVRARRPGRSCWPWALAFGGALFACAPFEGTVTRRVDGVTREGRFIDPEAYAYYALGALQEAHGQWQAALRAYQRALGQDDRGPELRTRIGAVACRIADPRAAKLASRAFAVALDRDPTYSPAWFEWAECAKRRGDRRTALGAAQIALKYDPERYATSLLTADLLEELGHVDQANQLRDALSTHAPGSADVQRALYAVAKRRRDTVRMARAERALSAIEARTMARAPASLATNTASAEQALERGDVSFAAELSERALLVDEGDGDALIIALCAADLSGDEARFTRLLAIAERGGRPAQASTLKRLEALLSRRVGTDAARALQTAAR